MKHLLSCLVLLFGSTAAIATEQTDAEKRTQRIIALAPHIVESLFEIGAGEQIIGTTDHADFPEAANTIPIVGNHARLQIERIIQLKPDLVLAWKTGNPSDDLERLEKYGINLAYVHIDTLDDVATAIRTLGQLTGYSENANGIANAYTQALSALKKQYANKASVSVFYELWPNPLRTVANNAWPQQQLSVCGATNTFANLTEDYPLVSIEQVLLHQPQILIQPNKQQVNTEQSIKWQSWPHIPAIKHNQVLHPNPDKVHRMTTRMLDELILLCKNIDNARQFYTK